jgi:glyoxylate reductase
VFVSRALRQPALERLAAAHEVDIWPGAQPPAPAELRSHTAACEGLLCTLSDRIDAELLDACPRLRVIANYAVGYDNIDVAAARVHGVTVGNTPDVLTDATADVAFGLLLAAARRLVEGDRAVRAGEWGAWRPDFLIGPDVSGTTLGIVGYGKIGQAVARRARGFDMDVLWSSSSGGTPLLELLQRSDHVSLHCPLTEATFHLIDEAALRAMKPTAILVNAARGAIVDAVALRRALEEGWIAAAGLDVTEPEPLAPDDPLLGAPGLVVTPHIASASVRARARMADLAVDNVLAGLAGEALPHAVT